MSSFKRLREKAGPEPFGAAAIPVGAPAAETGDCQRPEGPMLHNVKRKASPTEVDAERAIHLNDLLRLHSFPATSACIV